MDISHKRDITTEDIMHFFKRGDFNNNFTLGVTEFCPYDGSKKRIDAFYFNRWNREAIGYEVKISRQDFLHDKKWEGYLEYCTKFYFAAPKGVIKPEELPESIGLIEFEVVEKYRFNKEEIPEDEKTYEIKWDFTRKCRKLHNISDENYVRLLEGLVIKLIYNKNLL